MSEPTFDDTPRLVPAGPIYQIIDAEGREVGAGTLLNGEYRILRNGEWAGRILSHNARQVDSLSPLILSEPNYTFTTTIYRTGSGDGRGGNARDRRKARRARRSLGDVIRQAQVEQARLYMRETMNRAMWSGDAPDLRRWTPLSGGEWKVTP